MGTQIMMKSAAVLLALAVALVAVSGLPTQGGSQHLDAGTSLDVASDLAKLKAMRDPNAKQVSFKHVQADVGPMDKTAVENKLKSEAKIPSKAQLGADLAALKAMEAAKKEQEAPKSTSLGESAKPMDVQSLANKNWKPSAQSSIADEKKVAARFAKMPTATLKNGMKENVYEAAMANYHKALADDKKAIAKGEAIKNKVYGKTKAHHEAEN